MQPEPSIQPSPIVTYQDYSPEFKAEAIAHYEANGENYTLTAKQLGIPPDTVRYWTR
jgi:transposase-like protein